MTIHFHRSLELDTKARRAIVDGIARDTRLGNWMFYLPETSEKFFHANAGTVDCIHPSRPSNAALQQDWADKTYTSADWRRALTTPLEARLAEVWVASVRLWKAGLGSRPLGVTLVDDFRRDGVVLGSTLGLVIENAEHLTAKAPTRDEDMIAAGVQPDRIRGSLREQIRGYVIDLCSVVGVQPIDAAQETTSVRAWIDATRAAAPYMDAACDQHRG